MNNNNSPQHEKPPKHEPFLDHLARIIAKAHVIRHSIRTETDSPPDCRGASAVAQITAKPMNFKAN